MKLMAPLQLAPHPRDVVADFIVACVVAHALASSLPDDHKWLSTTINHVRLGLEAGCRCAILSTVALQP